MTTTLPLPVSGDGLPSADVLTHFQELGPSPTYIPSSSQGYEDRVLDAKMDQIYADDKVKIRISRSLVREPGRYFCQVTGGWFSVMPGDWMNGLDFEITINGQHWGDCFWICAEAAQLNPSYLHNVALPIIYAQYADQIWEPLRSCKPKLKDF